MTDAEKKQVEEIQEELELHRAAGSDAFVLTNVQVSFLLALVKSLEGEVARLQEWYQILLKRQTVACGRGHICGEKYVICQGQYEHMNTKLAEQQREER